MSEGTPKGYEFKDAWNLFTKTFSQLVLLVFIFLVIEFGLLNMQPTVGIFPDGEMGYLLMGFNYVLGAYLVVILVHAISGFTQKRPINVLQSASNTIQNTISYILAYLIITVPIGLILYMIFGENWATIKESIASLEASKAANTANTGAEANLQDASESLRALMENISYLIGILLLVGVIALYFATRFFTLAVVIVENNVGPIEGLKQAWNQTKGYFWDTLAMLLCVILVGAFVNIVLTFLSSLLLAGVAPEDQRMATTGVTMLGMLVLYPLKVCAMVIQKQKLDLVKGLGNKQPSDDTIVQK